MHIGDILKKPYARLVIPDGDSGFVAEIVEFSGCFAIGETAEAALKELDLTAADWIRAALAHGQKIPEPLDTAGYSGKLVLRMTKGLHQRAAFMAEREGVSLNQFIVTCVSEQVGMKAASHQQVAQIFFYTGLTVNSGIGQWPPLAIPQAAQPQPLMPFNTPNISPNPATVKRGVQYARS